MKPRKVYVMLEIESALGLKELGSVYFWQNPETWTHYYTVFQASANVAQAKKRKRRAAPKSRRRKQ